MVQLLEKAQLAWPVARCISAASENEECNLNTLAQIYQMQMQESYMKWVHAGAVRKYGVCQMCSTQAAYQCSKMFKISMSSEV